MNYDNDACGPFRDNVSIETPFQCDPGKGCPPGFRFCKSPAETILDAGADGGNFPDGLAVYVDGLEVVLKTQLRAGWYKNVMEWRFHVDGTISLGSDS